MRENTRFKFQGKTFIINFICSYGGALSRSGQPAADYQITGSGCRIRFETDQDLPRGGIERTGLAARKRAEHSDFQKWVKERMNYANVGQAYRAINRS